MAGRPTFRRARATLAALPALCVCLSALVGAQPASATDWTELRTLNIAHQGGENEAPSNTMYALERSMRLGSDMLEIDIHTSADDELVVIHDSTVDRTTNGTGRVYDLTLEQIQALDSAHNLVPGEGARSGREAAEYPFRGVRLGERKPPPAFGPDDFRIPSLDEVIKAFPNVPINIEIKGAADTDVDSFLHNAEVLAAYLNDLGRSDGIMVASFNDAAIQRFHQLAPQIDLAPAIVGVAAYKLAGVPPVPAAAAFQVPIGFNGITVVDQPFIQRAHSDGYGVHVWTINDPAEMHQLLNWGADGIMTAEPMRLEEVLCERGDARPPRPGPRTYGPHCNPRASIACDVVASKAKRAGGGKALSLTLTRADDFAGRCAGKVAVKGGKGSGARGRGIGKFEFGDLPPSEGGPASVKAKVKLPKKLRKAAGKRGAEIRTAARPYGAFVGRATLRVR